MPADIPHIEKLLKKARQGDSNAFREIYRLYYDRLIRYGCSLGASAACVHDVTQDLFVWLLQNPSKMEAVSHLDSYLYKCLRRNIYSVLERDRRKMDNAKKFYADAGAETSMESQLLETENRQAQAGWIRAQLDQLSSHQKEVIYLRFFENLSYEEMAEILSVSNQVVRNSVFRALKKLRENAAQTRSDLLKGIHFLISLL